MDKTQDLNDMGSLYDIVVNLGNGIFRNDNVQKLMMDPSQKFDVVILEWLFWEVGCG